MKHLSHFGYSLLLSFKARNRLTPRLATVAAPIAALLLPLGLSGCGRGDEPVPAIAEALVVGPEYSASKGLYVPEETRRSLGLELADVAEDAVAGSLEFSLRVYATAGEGVRASGQLASDWAKRVAIGGDVTLRVPDGRAVNAKVTAISAPLGSGSPACEILVVAPEASGLPPGTFLNGTIALPGSDAGAVVPRGAVVHSTEGPFVYTVSGEHFVRTPVKIGTTGTDAAEITEGLYAGDQVVSRGAMSLWLTELAAIKGGHSCCVVPPKGSG